MRRALAGIVALGLLLTACQWILGIEDEPGAPPDPIAMPEAGGPDAAPACVFARPPGRPDPGPETTLPAMFFAVKEFRFRRGAAVRGYDLDGFCTGEATTPSGSPCKRGRAEVQDEDGGVDNATANVKLFADDSPAIILNNNIAKNAFTLLLQLAQYNGLPNDDLVTVAFISGTGLTAGATCDGGVLTDAATGGCPQTWDFPAGEAPLRPNQVVLEGWVKDNVLVVRGKEDLKFGLDQSTVKLNAPLVTARLVPADGTWTLVDGLINGRIPVGNLLGVIGSFDIAGRLCSAGHPIGAPARDSICAARDLMAAPDAEPTESRCDALSFVLGFDAVRALTGAAKEIPSVAPCPEEYLRCPD